MSKSQHKAYSSTVFVVEGNPLAIVVTDRAGRLSKRNRRFGTPEAALAWCRSHAARLVYSPASDPSLN